MIEIVLRTTRSINTWQEQVEVQLRLIAGLVHQREGQLLNMHTLLAQNKHSLQQVQAIHPKAPRNCPSLTNQDLSRLSKRGTAGSKSV